MSETFEDYYIILEGVHRSYAAFKAGLKQVYAAVEDRDGTEIGRLNIDIELLYSPKNR
jgi:hypothetical protein